MNALLLEALMAERCNFRRLPTAVVPIHYDLRLKVLLSTDEFEGEEDVVVEFKEAVESITFNCCNIIVQWATLLLENEHFDDLPVAYDRKWSMATLEFPKQVDSNQRGTLKLRFTGELKKSMSGFYISTYQRGRHVVKLASTQFEPDDARCAFPCWDEPMFKATFKIALTIPSELVALSNTRALETVDLGTGWKRVEFATTPLMSTYLVAFAVGDFQYVEVFTNRGIPVRLYSTPGKSHMGHFALDVARRALDFFESYFDVEYTLDKCDLLAVPDFSMGASENWGLITFRELYVLMDPSMSSTVAKQNVALVVAHEVSHMWFGNLATMKWWTDLWLKEGFATWMEVKAVNQLFPEYDVWTQFALEHVREALMLDSMSSSHPIELPIILPSDIEENYDALSYSKGAAVVNMMEAYLGEEAFKAGIRQYLQTYAFSNAEADDLWRVLEEVSGMEVREMMGQWTRQEGYPVVRAQLRRDNGAVLLQLEQRRFVSSRRSNEQNNLLWKVPVTMNSPNLPSTKLHVLNNAQDIIELEGFENFHWLKLNVGLSGFYRVQYSMTLMSSLLPRIAEKLLPPVDRMQICDDLFALARAGKVSYVDFLDLLNNYKTEDEFIVLSCIISSLSVMLDCAQGQSFERPLHNFCRQFFEPLARRLGWQQAVEEKHTVSMLRSMVMDILSKCNDQNVIETANDLFCKYIIDGTPLLPDLRSMIFSSASRYGGFLVYEKLLDIYKKTTFSEVQRDCLRALGCSGRPEVLTSLTSLLDSDSIRIQDVHLALLGMVQTPAGRQEAWKFFQTCMENLAYRYGGTKRPLFQKSMEICTQYLCSADDATSVQLFFAEQMSSDPAVKRLVQQSVESIHLNAHMLKRDGQKLSDWLHAHGY
uniref:Aminopeptidase n=1 Tax=Trichuris muris TaxID=70415 RepID=A0A5S6QC43_TRIMR